MTETTPGENWAALYDARRRRNKRNVMVDNLDHRANCGDRTVCAAGSPSAGSV
ncbi:hypothetical protein [Roseovarius sp. THAF8]|uniref:hypothetical protein n=1 Tax=Roseovarius sp. THAF8 TaxID=2587846 RepID=UPI0015629EDA|nr:hypothetical protein [Roseovarius sp. THAF8]